VPPGADFRRFLVAWRETRGSWFRKIPFSCLKRTAWNDQQLGRKQSKARRRSQPEVARPECRECHGRAVAPAPRCFWNDEVKTSSALVLRASRLRNPPALRRGRTTDGHFQAPFRVRFSSARLWSHSCQRVAPESPSDPPDHSPLSR
jgi:hypothetical protein